MKRAAILSLSLSALIVGTACYARTPQAEPNPGSATAEEGGKTADTPDAPGLHTPVEEVIVSTTGLYGDWKMVLPDYPGFDRPVIGDFCNFRKRGDDVSIICADGFLQEIPEVTFNADTLRLRWGGALTHTIYDAVWVGSGTFDGELTQAQMGIVTHRLKAKMERVSDQPPGDVPQQGLAVLNNYFDDMASGTIRENYYEGGVYSAMKKAVAARPYSRGARAVKYFGTILEDRGHGATFPYVFKVSNGGKNEQWCLVRVDAERLADVRCSDIR